MRLFDQYSYSRLLGTTPSQGKAYSKDSSSWLLVISFEVTPRIKTPATEWVEMYTYIVIIVFG